LQLRFLAKAFSKSSFNILDDHHAGDRGDRMEIWPPGRALSRPAILAGIQRRERFVVPDTDDHLLEGLLNLSRWRRRTAFQTPERGPKRRGQPGALPLRERA
jgi:hypothetical protein